MLSPLHSRIMAVGTKQGCLCLYGRPGVEMSSSHDSGAAVLQLFFLPGQGRIVALLEDNTLHLWQVRQLWLVAIYSELLSPITATLI